MKNCISFVAYVLVGIIALVFLPIKTFAGDILIDNFSSINSGVWNIEENGGSVSILDDNLILSAPQGIKFPYISLIGNLQTNSEYHIAIRFKFSGFLQYGNGIVFSNNKIENDRYEINSSDFIFQIWPKNSNNFGIFTSLCPESLISCTENIGTYEIPTNPSHTMSDDWHRIEIRYNDGKYKLSLDGFEIFSSKLSSRNIDNVWFGNFERLNGSAYWATIYLDYLQITQPNKYFAVIVPGLGASWDMEALLSGTEGSNWQIPSFVKVYDGLVNSFKNAGYSDTTNKNLYVFSYDWRRSLDSLADRLNLYINSLPLQSGEKIDLIGHSMGGLVARAYVQKYGVEKINKILTVGSPNMGTVKAYSIWEGAKLWDDVWWAKVALEMTTHFGATLGETKVKTLQRMAPSIKDLLPTYDYLVLNGNTLPWLSLKSKNTYLNNLNQNITQINSQTTAIYSSDIQTDSLIKVVNPSRRDILVDLWLDGKPIEIAPYIKTSGDGTVIQTSAKGPFGNILQGNGWHGELVTREDNIKKIFAVLGLDQTKVVAGLTDNKEQVFVAALRSPGKMEVCNFELTKCNEQLGLYFQDNKLFIFPGYDNEKLRITITEDGQLGEYKLHMGNIDDDSAWTVVGGNLNKDGQIDIYNIRSIGGNLFAQKSPSDKERCKRDGWRNFSFFNFRNQGDCISFVDRFKKPFWWK